MLINSFLDYLLIEKKYSKHTIIAYEKDLNDFQLFCISECEDQSIISVNYSQIRSYIVSLVTIYLIVVLSQGIEGKIQDFKKTFLSYFEFY